MPDQHLSADTVDGPSGPWTRHGHAVPGVTVEGSGRPPVARCGGPKICAQCALDAERLRRDVTRYRLVPGQPDLLECVTCTARFFVSDRHDCSTRPDDDAIKAVLLFADGVALSETGRALADLYNDTCPQAEVLRWAGCHPKRRHQSDGPSSDRGEFDA